MKFHSWLVSLLSVCLIVSLTILPTLAQAESKVSITKELHTAKQFKIWQSARMHAYEEARLWKKGLRPASWKQVGKKDGDVITEATYTGAISAGQTHEYFFSLQTGGDLAVVNQVSTKPFYLIINIDTGDTYFPDDMNEIHAHVDAGPYLLSVAGSDEGALDYQLLVNGVTFMGAPDTTLPTLTVTSPAQADTHLPKDQPALTFEGTVEGAVEASAQLNWEDKFNLPNSFHRLMHLPLGSNHLSAYARNKNGNGVYEEFSIGAPGLERIDGMNRYDVSAHISQRLPVASSVTSKEVGESTVVLARGDSYADALSGAPLATLNFAPILLTQSATLPDMIKHEIARRHADRVIILGGTAAISANVETQLHDLNVKVVDRITGANRYEVSANIAEKLWGDLPKEFRPQTAFVVSGEDFPDALSVSAEASMANIPILLVKKGQIPASIQHVIHDFEIKQFIIVGGTGVISPTVETALHSGGADVVRIAGKNRYETSVKVADLYNSDENMVARGEDFPDALSGGPYAAFLGAPIVLTPSGHLDNYVAVFEDITNPFVIHLLGGTGAISSTVATQLDGYILH